jgi:hypothetical protein
MGFFYIHKIRFIEVICGIIIITVFTKLFCCSIIQTKCYINIESISYIYLCVGGLQ